MKILKLIRRYKFAAFRMLYELAFKDTVRVPVNGKIFYQHVDRSTLYHIIHSYPKVQALVDALPNLFGPIIDGGANNGLFSFMMEQRFKFIAPIAIEPNPILKPFVLKNNTGLFRSFALSDKCGEGKFYFDTTSDQTGSLTKSNIDGHSISAETSIKTLDFLCSSFARISVLKLDLQGGELAALKGATEILKKTDYLILEVYTKAPGALEAVTLALQTFPYWKAINSVPYGADILFSKTPLP